MKGRPRQRAPKPGERVSLGLRVTAEMKARLDEAAAKSGRSQSQEAELRLEKSFSEDRVFGGADQHQIAMLMASAFLVRGQQTAAQKDLKGDWLRDPDCYAAAIFAVVEALMIGAPAISKEDLALQMSSLTGRLATRLANREG